MTRITMDQPHLRLVKTDDFDLCNSCSLNAASPPGAEVRPHSMSLIEEGASPTSSPISASVIPLRRRSEMREAQVTVGITPRVRDSVLSGQRHSITEFRCNAKMDDVPDFRTIGERLRYWRKRRKIAPKLLAEKAHIAVSTLYGIENGDQQGSTALGLLADVLRLRPKYLATGEGPIESVVTAAEIKATDWPFSFDKRRLQNLTETEFELIELMLLNKLEKIESRRGRRKAGGES